MQKLTVTVITKNEERNIARCLQSIKEIADEIVVVDSGSTDKTENICKEHNAKFFFKLWEGYSVARNHAASLATNNWILSLDADEAISDKLKESIIQLKKTDKMETGSLKRLTNYCGHWIRHCGWYPDLKIRLYDKSIFKWEGIIHEEIIPKPKKSILLKGDLLHYSYYTISEHIQQADRFTTITAQVAFEKGKSSNIFKILFSPILKFIKSYLLQLGFLDGIHGFIVCRISANATFYKYLKLWKLQRKK